MAKGAGWAMAAVGGLKKVAYLRGKWYFCPVCGGQMTVGSMTEQFKCCSERDEDMPLWLRNALKEAGFEPWSYYTHDGAIPVLAVAANGVQLTPMRDRGRFGGWQWEGVPEGEITFNIDINEETWQAYIRQRMETWTSELESLLSHPDVTISEEALESSHPQDLLNRAKGQISTSDAKRKKEAEKEAERVRDQGKLDSALRDNGFFDGRVGKAQINWDACVVIRQTSSGDRDNPHRLIASTVQGSLTVEKLSALVKARGDYSKVEVRGSQVVIVSPDPGQWIGRQGATIKALGQALGGYIKVEEAR